MGKQGCTLEWAQVAPFARRKTRKLEFADGNSHQTQRGMSDGGSHAPHLPVTSFVERDFDPCRGYALTETNRWFAWRKIRLALKQMNLCGSRAIALDRNSLAQPAQLILARYSFYLNPVSAWVFKLRITEAVLQHAIIGQKYEPLTVMIQPADGVDVSDGNEVSKSFPLARKLANDPIGFIENDVAKSHPSD